MSSSPTFANSYLATNRSDPTTYFVDSKTFVVPLASGGLSYYTSSSPYDQNPDDYSSVPVTSGFLAPLEADLKNTIGSNGQANLAVYIHGLGVTFDDAITETAAFGSALASPGGYNGLLIGFDWPSYGEVVAPLASYYATGRPPQNTSGTSRDNINGSTAAFVNLMQMLLAIRVNNQPLNLDLITHSEGNFMAAAGNDGASESECIFRCTLVIYLCGTGNEQSVMYLKTKNAEGKEVPGWYTVINPYRIPRRIFDANPNTPAKKIKWAALGPANPSTRAYELTIDKYSEWISTRAGRLSLLGGTAEGPTTAAKPSPTPGTLDADKKPAAAAGAVAAEIRSQTELEEERELVIKFAGLIAKGNAQRVANNYSGAEQAYSDANKLIPSDSRSLYGLGNVYFDQQRWKGAEEAYRRAISLNSHFPEAYLALAKVLIGPRKGEINADRLFEAENYLWITASLQPQNEKVYNLLDTVLEKRRASTAEFEAVYRRVLKLSPESVGTNLRLSSLLRRLGRQDEAKKHLQIAETAASGLEELLDLAEVFESQKRYNKAERLARRALSLDSNSKDGRAPLILGLVLIDREQYLAAVPWLQRATQASRDDFIPRYLLGIARLRSGDLDNAERSFDEAIGKVSAPEQESYATACWLVLLGDAYSVTGRKSDAVRVYERALTYDPDDSETRDKLSKIRTTLKP